jgi:hypothetical protein
MHWAALRNPHFFPQAQAALDDGRANEQAFNFLVRTATAAQVVDLRKITPLGDDLRCFFQARQKIAYAGKFEGFYWLGGVLGAVGLGAGGVFGELDPPGAAVPPGAAGRGGTPDFKL